MASKSSEVAKERWKFLRDALLKKKRQSTDQQHSVRRFSTFQLFDVQHLPSSRSTDTATIKWSQYTHSTPLHLQQQISVKVGLITEDITLQDMMGFNNTGNVCIWPSEEVMAYYCLENIELFDDKIVCELGSGMTGLAGIMLAKTSVPNRMILTDGNQKSIDNLKIIIQENNLSSIATANVLRWDTPDDDINSQNFFEQIDVIICADCFFFIDVQKDLILLMNKLLKCNGKAILLAPERSSTFSLFIEKARKYFKVETYTRYHSRINEKHKHFLKTNPHYDTDLHYPYCVVLYKQ